MRVAALVVCTFALWAESGERVSISRVAVDRPYQALDLKRRLDVYWRGSFSLSAGIQAFAPAWIDHARMRHREWGGGMEGYGARIGNRYGRFLAGRTIEHSAAAALGLEPRYIPCRCTSFGPRLKHAMKATFVTYDRNGKWVPNVSRFAGIASVELIAPMWQPPRDHYARDLAGRMGLRFGLSMVTNTGREFQAELRKLIPFGKR